jgi:RNA polymerase sigma factor (sigma-70 family)
MRRISTPNRIGKPALDERSDEELLSRFIADGEEAAFTALIERYEAMVLRVCMRVLRQRQDAEDACQATFVVLLRKAGLIRDKHKLGNWLYGVAYRVALRVRKKKMRRENHECVCVEITQISNEVEFPEECTLFNEAVQRLPEKYRTPYVLCQLEGKSKAEAAAELGWPKVRYRAVWRGGESSCESGWPSSEWPPRTNPLRP